MTNCELAEFSALRVAAKEYATRARLAPMGVTDDPLPIQILFSAICDGHTVHLSRAIDATQLLEKAEVAFWKSTIEAAKHALVLWERVETEHGPGCLADVDKWLKHCPPEIVGIDTIKNSRQLISRMGKDFRDRVVSFTASALQAHRVATEARGG
jgi:hypothetical protein